MSRYMFPVACLAASLVMAGRTPAALGQWYPAANPCACTQPVLQTCYQTVPVTEYRKVKQTVRRPIIETRYVEQPVTEYHPVTETRTVDVPTVSYQTITECRTIQRDCGRWVAQYHPVYKPSPCEYDSRPDLIGWLNRTAYSVRMAFTPSVYVSRQYVPNIVTQVVPVTRTVAVPTTRKVTYNVTRMVPRTTTRKVAVNTVRYVEEQVDAVQPVTVYRTVPVGTSVAYAYSPIVGGSTQTALSPTPDPISRGSSAPRTAEAPSSNDAGSGETLKPFRREENGSREVPADGASYSTPLRRSSAEPTYPEARRAAAPESKRPPVAPSRSVPSIVRVNRWTSRTSASTPSAPQLVSPSPVSVAGTE